MAALALHLTGKLFTGLGLVLKFGLRYPFSEVSQGWD